MQQLNKRAFTITVFIFSSLTAFCQQSEQDSVHAIIKEMAAYNQYEVTYSVGFAGAFSKQYQRFEKLISIASPSQLIEIAGNHKNAVVRLYAYQALKFKKAAIPETLIRQFDRDKTHVQTFTGCIAEERTVNSLKNETIFNSLTIHPASR
jgi:hypothetical protein